MANILSFVYRVQPKYIGNTINDFLDILRKIENEEDKCHGQIEYYCDNHKQCYYFRFTSKRFTNILEDIEILNRFQISVLISEEGGSTDNWSNINNKEYGKKAIYQLDKLRIYSKDKLEFLQNNLILPVNYQSTNLDYTEIKVNGQYEASNYFAKNYYDIGIKKIPYQEMVCCKENSELSNLQLDINWNLQELYNNELRTKTKNPNLNKIEIFFQNRLVKEIFFNGLYNTYSYSYDFWDNLLIN